MFVLDVVKSVRDISPAARRGRALCGAWCDCGQDCVLIATDHMLAAAILLTPALFSPRTVPPKSIVSRRSALAAIAAPALLAIGAPASAIVDSTNPASNYYFPMAKYRYLPRVLRAWIAVDSLGPQALGASDWEGLHVVWERADDAVTAMPLYTNAVEGSRSSKRKKKSDVRRPAANPHITATHPSRSCGAGAEVNAMHNAA